MNRHDYRTSQLTNKFKIQGLCEIEAGTSLAHVTRWHHLHRDAIRKWRDWAFSDNGHAYTSAANVAELE